MMEMKIWNRLCEKVNKKIDVSEGRFEKEIALEFLSALNWSEYYDNLKEQYQIDVHGDKWIPDFALFVDGKDEPDIIVELKKPTHKQRSKDRRQITTYMKLVDCRFGLYFGEKLELFYLDYEPEKRVSKSVLSVDFTKNDKNGKRLIDLLKYDSYDRNQLRSFCEDQLKLEDVCKFWCSDEGLDKLYNYILNQSQLPVSLTESLRYSLDISVSQKIDVNEQEDESVNGEINGSVEQTDSEAVSEDHLTFNLKESKKGTEAMMIFFPQEQKYVIKTNSKVSKKDTKDCSPEALELRKKVFADKTWSRDDGNVYVLLRDVVIASKTGTPNVSANFCTGRSTNARTAWIDGQGRTYGEIFSKNRIKKITVPEIKSTASASRESSFIANCISRVGLVLGCELIKKSGNAYMSLDGKAGFVFRTSKIYQQGKREKYWYAYKRSKEIDECKNQYYVFGCNNENTIILMPISEIEAHIDGLNYSKDANDNPLYWHIVFLKDEQGKMTWLISKPNIHEIDITNKLLK